MGVILRRFISIKRPIQVMDQAFSETTGLTDVNEYVMRAGPYAVNAGATGQPLSIVTNLGEWDPGRPVPLAPLEIMHFGRHSASGLLLCEAAKVRLPRTPLNTRSNRLPR